MMNKVVNAVLFQALWFTAILSGWLYALPILVLHLAHFFYAERSAAVRSACLGLAFVGIVADSVLGALGVYQFNADNLLVLNAIPLWLCYMWLGFATCLPVSLAWLLRSPLILVGFFSVGGSLSYMAGRSLGALSFQDSAIPIIAGLWFSIACLVLIAGSVFNRSVPQIRLQSE